jgi:cellulose synthase/poly-beta-1,6-N-acetylglucosamine synthase-like glycosyltransferase
MTVLLVLLAGATLFYTYAGYPALLCWLVRRQPKVATVASQAPSLPPSDHQNHATPMVSIIIPFHNEESWVARKLDNTLSLDYPRERTEIIAISDGSTDRTAEIMERYRDQVRIVAYMRRQGKPTALNRGVALAKGEILVFTDANVVLDPKALRALVCRYADPSVGGVSANVALEAVQTDEPLGEGLYMKYERWLYALESQLHSMVGADGALFSIRRDLFTPLAADTITDDFSLALEAIDRGKRVLYEPRAGAVEGVVPDVTAEFKRKVRMVAGGYQALWRFRHLLLPKQLSRHRTFALQLISHKVLRWIAPLLLVTVYLGSAMTAASTQSLLWAGFTGLQSLFYLLAGAGWLNTRIRRWPLCYIPYYFCAVNLAATLGAWRFLRGRQAITWQKVSRAA